MTSKQEKSIPNTFKINKELLNQVSKCSEFYYRCQQKAIENGYDKYDPQFLNCQQFFSGCVNDFVLSQKSYYEK